MSTTRFILGSTTRWETLPVRIFLLNDELSFMESPWVKKRGLVTRHDYYYLAGKPSDTFMFDGDQLGEYVIRGHEMMLYLWK